jgi:phenylpropionate dioxygenase-like ring-hydroxylating dioxygenase large terminal subunit
MEAATGGVTELLARLAEAAARPAGGATGLPPELYTEAAILRLEEERIFAHEWLCAGLAAEIPSPGDYLTFAIGEQPVIVVRGPDGAIRGLSNVCRHRMSRLVGGRGNARVFACPYHAWTYDLTGRLMGAPHMARSDGFDKTTIRLPEIRTEIWEGWIYVTLDPAADGVAQKLAALQPVVAPYRMAGYAPFVTQDHVWDTNWKLLTENFMEGYHLPVAHKRTVGAWFPAEETGFPQQAFESFTYQTFIKNQDAKYGLAHKDNRVLAGRWRHTSVMPTIYPSHMAVIAPDHLWYLSLRPKGVGQVHVRFGAALAPEVLASLADKEAFLAETVAFFDRVNAEDKDIVESIYRGARAPLARSGPLSWLERELHDFQGYLARRLCGANQALAAAQ